MGTVYRKSFTKPLPPTAEVFTRVGQRFGRWKDAKGKQRTAPLTTGTDGTDRIVVEARTFTAKYRDGSGVVREVATGCRDETAARSVLGELERRAELVKAGVMTAAEDSIADFHSTAFEKHLAAYESHLTARGTCPEYRNNTIRQLRRLYSECGITRLADLDTAMIERWMIERSKPSVTVKGTSKPGMSARTRNAYRADLVTFANWCIADKRLLVNPFERLPVADERADRRRHRRAMTEAELVTLLDIARRRPLLEALTIRRGKNKGATTAKVRPEVQAQLERLGRERALIYKTLVLTGLRKGELASLTVGQVQLDDALPYLVLHAADEKNRQGTTIPLRSDLATDLRMWINDKAATLQAASQAATVRFDSESVSSADGATLEAGAAGKRSRLPMTMAYRLPASTSLFEVPDKLVKILDRDLKAAGIAKRDDRGQTIDVHALRHSFGTLLSKAGVAPRTAQAAMRHSSINLTMNVYTDPRLLDVSGAVESLPSLPLSAEHGQSEILRNVARATGTDDYPSPPLAPTLAPTPDKSCKSWSSPDKSTNGETVATKPVRRDVTSCEDKRKRSATSAVDERHKGWLTGFEPVTSRTTI